MFQNLNPNYLLGIRLRLPVDFQTLSAFALEILNLYRMQSGFENGYAGLFDHTVWTIVVDDLFTVDKHFCSVIGFGWKEIEAGFRNLNIPGKPQSVIVFVIDNIDAYGISFARLD